MSELREAWIQTTRSSLSVHHLTESSVGRDRGGWPRALSTGRPGLAAWLPTLCPGRPMVVKSAATPAFYPLFISSLIISTTAQRWLWKKIFSGMILVPPLPSVPYCGLCFVLPALIPSHTLSLLVIIRDFGQHDLSSSSSWNYLRCI